MNIKICFIYIKEVIPVYKLPKVNKKNLIISYNQVFLSVC